MSVDGRTQLAIARIASCTSEKYAKSHALEVRYTFRLPVQVGVRPKERNSSVWIQNEIAP